MPMFPLPLVDKGYDNVDIQESYIDVLPNAGDVVLSEW
jgi:hypothetical protein